MNTKDNQEAEREAFEKWLFSQNENFDINNPIDYMQIIEQRETSYQWEAWKARATLTTPKVNEEVASGEAVCSICNNSGYYCTGYSGLECDGNAPMLERCDCEIGQPTPSPSNVLVEANMATDLEKLKALLASFGINYRVYDDTSKDYHADEGETCIVCREGDKGIEGYIGFYTRFTFDKNGKFISMGAYE